MAPIFFIPRFVYNDGSAIDFEFSISQRPWSFGSQGVGGSDTAAGGVPASFEIRRDFFLHLTLRFLEEEWEDVERMVRHFQAAGSATFYPDKNEVGSSHTVYGVRPAMGEEIRPTRSGENRQVFELNITLRRTTEAIFTDEYYEPAAFTDPNIAGEEFNWDASLQTEDDLATVSPWTDQTGNANHATVDGGSPHMLVDGWAVGVRAVFCGVNENFVFTGTPFQSSELTYFFVFEATEISSHCPLIGSYASSSAPRYPSVFVLSDGRIVYNLENDPFLAVSASGVIVQGGKYVVTVRQSGTTGVVIRVNGTEVIAEAGATSPPVTVAPASVGLARDQVEIFGNFYGTDKLFAQFRGFSVAATDAEIVQMEGFLGQKWDVTIA